MLRELKFCGHYKGGSIVILRDIENGMIYHVSSHTTEGLDLVNGVEYWSNINSEILAVSINNELMVIEVKNNELFAPWENEVKIYVKIIHILTPCAISRNSFATNSTNEYRINSKHLNYTLYLKINAVKLKRMLNEIINLNGSGSAECMLDDKAKILDVGGIGIDLNNENSFKIDKCELPVYNKPVIYTCKIITSDRTDSLDILIYDTKRRLERIVNESIRSLRMSELDNDSKKSLIKSCETMIKVLKTI